MNVSRASVFVMEDQWFLLFKKMLFVQKEEGKNVSLLAKKKVYFQVIMLLISSFSCAYIIYIS